MSMGCGFPKCVKLFVVWHCVTHQVSAVSLIIAITTLFMLPSLRIWRSNGYDKSPGLAVTVAQCASLISYLVVSQLLLVRPLPQEQWWAGWYALARLVVVTCANLKARVGDCGCWLSSSHIQAVLGFAAGGAVVVRRRGYVPSVSWSDADPDPAPACRVGHFRVLPHW